MSKSKWLVFTLLLQVVSSGLLRILPRFLINRECVPPLGDVCVDIKECEFFTELLDKTPIPRPRSIINIIVKYQCAMGNDGPKVCCSNDRMTTTIKPTKKPKPTQWPTRLISDEYDLKNHKNFNMLPITECGPISVLTNRITHGKTAALEEFPWMVLIAYNSSDFGIEFRCGGTIISERFILTAAHCILNTSIFGVRLGEYDLNNTDQDCAHSYCSPPTQDLYIEDTIIHPKYNPKTHENDIALIKLLGQADISQTNIRPICLPLFDTNDDLAGKYAIISGWGATEISDMSAVPMKAEIPVLPMTTCKEIYDKYTTITINQICAGGRGGRDSCAGDSGGPLMTAGLIDGNPRYIQYGIVSFGPRQCGSEGQPGIYTKTKPYLKWILDNLDR